MIMELFLVANFFFQLRLLDYCANRLTTNSLELSYVYFHYVNADFPMNNTSINEQPLIAKQVFCDGTSIIISASVG